MTWDDAFFVWLDAVRLDPTLPMADFENQAGRLEAADVPRRATAVAPLASVASSAVDHVPPEPQPWDHELGFGTGRAEVESRPQPPLAGSSGVAALTTLEAE